MSNQNRIFAITSAAFAVIALSLSASVKAQDFSDVEIRSTEVGDGVYVLQGAGGNIGLVVGDQGSFLVDDQYAPLTEKIKSAVGDITDVPVKFVLNTHWHGDHTGGNENFAEGGALVFAHDNVRKRMSTDQVMEFFGREVEAAAGPALPVVTFNDRASFHLGGHTLHAVHVPNAHTDGDAFVHLLEANVIHAGDIVFFGLYPFIDYGSGGHIEGVINAVDTMLELSDEETRIIAGHGSPIITPTELRAYRSLLATLHSRLEKMISQGRSLQEIQDANITAEFDESWGQGFINPARWVEMNYQGMTATD